jgi:hypothetical protein
VVVITPHHADEAHALACDGPDQPLLAPAVVQRTPRSIDATRERRFRHDPAVPDGIDQVIACNHPIAIAHEIMNQIEHLRLDRDERSAPAQLAAFGIKQKFLELKRQ